MCLNPILIDNVNYGSKNPMMLALRRDVTNKKMYVPCGHCEQCVAARQNSFVQRVQAESRYNWLFFATLTYDNAHLPRLSVDVPVVGPDRLTPIELPSSLEQAEANLENFGFDLPEDNQEVLSGCALDDDVEYKTISFAFADIHDVQLLLKNVRDNNPLDGRELRYACVSELGKANGRPHFHILFFVEKRTGDTNPDGSPRKEVLRTLEARLRTTVKRYWAVNVGTRKQPVYEPRFQYARKWSFGKLYTNYDLHWVDPSLTADQTSNVAYYVSKYIMKGSDRDQRRQQFLRLNLDEDEYRKVWNVIKCRATFSKGLGLDARFMTVEDKVESVEYRPLSDVAADIDRLMEQTDDLPDFDSVELVKSKTFKVVKRRVMIPNFELAEKIRRDAPKAIGDKPGPIFISPDGKHRPLSHYYQRFGYIYTLPTAVAYALSWDPDLNQVPTKEDADKAERRMEKRRRMVDAHASFDNVSTVDMPQDDPTLVALSAEGPSTDTRMFNNGLTGLKYIY